MLRLPAKWREWCRAAKLRPHAPDKTRSQRDNGAWWYLKGRGYVWRINCYGEFQRGDTITEFDKWALCSINSVPMPKTAQAFSDAVTLLLEQA